MEYNKILKTGNVDGPQIDAFASYNILELKTISSFSCTFFDGAFYSANEGLVYQSFGLINSPDISPSAVVREVFINDGDERVYISTLAANRTTLIGQASTGEIGFIYNTSRGLVFKPQMKAVLDSTGSPIIHRRIYYSEYTDVWYGFNTGSIYEYRGWIQPGDALLNPLRYVQSNIFDKTDLWSITEVDRGKSFWYGFSAGSWLYYNTRIKRQLNTQPSLGVFGGFFDGVPVLLAVSIDDNKRITVDVISTDMYYYNTTVDVDFIQATQLRHNTGLLTTSNESNLLLHNAKVLHSTHDYQITVTLFAY